MSAWVDPYIREMERNLPIPLTSFRWQNDAERHTWKPEIRMLLDALMEKSRSQSSIFTGDGGRYDNPMSRVWRTCHDVLAFVVSTSEPCETHILRGRMLDVLEYKFPGQDTFHGDVLAAFGEMQHIVFMRERVEA